MILVAAPGVTHLAAAVRDLSGRLLAQHVERHDIAIGPEPTLQRVAEIFDQLVAAPSVPVEAQVWNGLTVLAFFESAR